MVRYALDSCQIIIVFLIYFNEALKAEWVQCHCLDVVYFVKNALFLEGLIRVDIFLAFYLFVQLVRHVPQKLF